MGYRLKVNYRGHWKLAKVEHSTLESVKESQKKLKAMGVQSKICDAAGKELEV